MHKLKKIICLPVILALLCHSVSAVDIEHYSRVTISTIGQIIINILQTCGYAWTSSSFAQTDINAHLNGYIDHVYGNYDVNAPTDIQVAWTKMLKANGCDMQVYNNSQYESFLTKYSDSIIYSTYLGSGQNLVIFNVTNHRDIDILPEIADAIQMNVNIYDYYVLAKDIVSYFSQFCTYGNENLEVDNVVDLLDSQQYFETWGENYKRIFYYPEYSDYTNGTLAVRVYFNDGNFDIYYNRPYSTSSNTQSFYFYAQGTYYWLYNNGVRVTTYTDWEDQRVRGNMYSHFILGTTWGQGNSLLPYIDIGFEKIPYTSDNTAPHYVKGVWYFGQYFDLTDLIDPENMPDTITPPENVQLDNDNLFDNDGFTEDEFIDYFDRKFFELNSNLEEIKANLPEVSEDGIDYPVFPVTNNYNYNTNNNINNIAPEITDPIPEIELPDFDDTISSGNADLDSLQIGGLIGKFPFCIPKDISDMLATFKAEPVAPVFKLRLPVPYVVKDNQKYYEFLVDLNKFNDLASLVRRFELVGFCLGLAVKTRDLIRG